MEENKDQLSETSDMDINSDADIPGINHLSNPDENDELEKLNKVYKNKKINI